VEPQATDSSLQIAIQLDQMKFRQRHFFLFDDLLLGVRELKSGKYKFAHSFNLLRLVVKQNISEALPIAPSQPADASGASETEADKQEPTEAHGTYFVLVEDLPGNAEGTGISKKEYVIKAASVEEKERWVKDIIAACEFANRAAKAINHDDEDSLKAMMATPRTPTTQDEPNHKKDVSSEEAAPAKAARGRFFSKSKTTVAKKGKPTKKGDNKQPEKKSSGKETSKEASNNTESGKKSAKGKKGK